MEGEKSGSEEEDRVSACLFLGVVGCCPVAPPLLIYKTYTSETH
jgi:hypothetical protein